MSESQVIVVGAGPAGLTAAWELAMKGIEVTVLEADPEHVGGLARTINYKGHRFDIGAHRFFSKNPEITRWWHERLPEDFVRIKRLTRIHFRGRFFHYPLRAGDALFGLGLWTSGKSVLSYLRRQMAPIRPERSFADWVCNRFGDELYRIFFKTYTEKVWGMPCSAISADWASQRIRGLSLRRAILDAVGIRQNSVRTLVDEFEYPRLGTGMLWEKVRADITRKGGRVLLGRRVTRLEREGQRISAVLTMTPAGEVERWPAKDFIVSMPLRDTVLNVEPPMAEPSREAARRLLYRDFLLVALIVNRTNLFPDQWIYIHDPAVKVGRIGNYNNWTSEMATDRGATCLEMEYFCSQGDSFWQQTDADLITRAKRELEQLGLAKAAEVQEACVVRVEKAYPVYDEKYRDNVNIIRQALAEIGNLQTIGRNGLHKYNNQDHSMLTGMLAARNVMGARHDPWRVNIDDEYHEEENNATTTGRKVPQRIAVEP